MWGTSYRSHSRLRRWLVTISLFVVLLGSPLLFQSNAIADTTWNITEVTHEPQEPFAGSTVIVYAKVQYVVNITKAQVQYCTIDPETMETGNCFFLDMEYDGNNTYTGNISMVFDGGTMIGYRVILGYDDGPNEYSPGEHDYFYYNYTGGTVITTEVEIPIEFVIGEVILGICVAALAGFLVYRRVKKVRTGTDKILAIGIIVILLIAILYAVVSLSGLTGTVEPVEDFSLTDIDGDTWNLSDHKDEVVILDFMAITCEPCEVLRQNLEVALGDFEEDDVEVISIAVGSDTDQDLRDYRDEREVNWTVARDTSNLVDEFGVIGLPRLVIIDRGGYPTYKTDSVVDSDKLRSKIDSALEGRAQPISIAQVGIFATAVFMGIATYFSPCSFPMLPGYVSFYLSTEAEKKKSLATVLGSGLISGFGIILVFLIIGIVAISLGEAANLSDYLIYMGPIVGILLIVMGALTFTNLQYHAMVRPFQKAREKLFGKKAPGVDDRAGYYTKLFSYGVGYGAAASACTAPLFVGLLLAGIVAGSFLDGIIMMVIFSITIILLMVAITLLLSAFGQESVQKLSAHTDTIKKISGVVLVIVGIYLIYYYLSTFVWS